ncbi:phage tail tape measure protein [Spirosoma sp. KNUC1025]|uniref:phage tail tape measure protein n=1 Tax=Spirosoma sp. KNUC1025 TaxID=2894082 RepID=UPI00386D11F3|nr:phage tail tape measure protein [Spirosoma sp. KNUC1025]
MAQTIEAKYNLDLDDFFAKMDKVSNTLGIVEDTLKRQSQIDPFGKAASQHTEFNRTLGQQVQIYQRVQTAVVSLEKEQARLKQTLADVKKRQDELTAVGQYNELKKQLDLVEKALDRLNKPLKEADSWWDRLRAKIARGLSIPAIKLPTPGGSTTGKKDSFLGQAGEAALDKLGDATGLSLSGGTLAAGAAVAATAGTVIKGTKEWAAYGEKLSEVSALTGATGKSLDYLDSQAQKIERDTGIAGTTVLEAFKNIAGIKPELLENNAALAQTTKEVITLAQASKLSLEESAKALLGSLSQFEEGADQAARFSNVLAAGAKLGNSEINDTAEALKNSGTAMKAAGLSFEEGNALLQTLAGKMIKGSEAGTALRNVLLKLETDSDKNLRPSIVGLNTALDNAAKKYDTTSEQAKVFGAENIVAAKQVLEGRDAIAKMTETLTGTQVAYEQARANTDNLATDLRKAGTSIDAFFRNLGQSNDGFLRGMVQRFTSFVNEIGSKTSVFKTFLSSYVNNEEDGLIGALFTAGRVANKQRQTNLDAARKEARQSGVVTATKQSVEDDLKILTELNKKRGEVESKAERDAADTVKKQRDAIYQQAVADHQRLRKELEKEIQQTGKDSGKLNDVFNKSREALLSASTGKKLADAQVTRLKKLADEQAATLAKLTNEPMTDEQKKAGKKAQDIENETNRLLLEARQEYAKEVQKLELEYGKERLELLQKDGTAYINARADLDQKELKLQRDATEKKLQLAKSNKVMELNGRRQVVADTSITLANSASQIAQIFADRQQQIEDERNRQLQLSRVRQEYQLLELAKKSNANELAIFDKYWEEKLLIEQKNSAVYTAMIKKRDRERNALVVDQILKQTRDQQEIELAFTSTDPFGQNLRTNDPSLNAEDIIEKRQQAQLAIRIKFGEETIRLLKEQGESENAVLITQTKAAVDELKKQQDELKTNSPKFHDIYDLLGITDGMDQTQLDAVRKGFSQIGDAITEVTSLIVQQSEERIAAIDREIQAKQEQVDIESERSKEGYANNLSLRQAELNDLKRQKADEEQVRRKALKVQQALDTASTISNAAMTVSNGITFLTRLAAEEIKLGPIAGPIAFLVRWRL